jgi:hypothetical protein
LKDTVTSVVHIVGICEFCRHKREEERRVLTSFHIGCHNISLLVFIPAFHLVVFGGGRSGVTSESYEQESAIKFVANKARAREAALSTFN